jgi:hypothetical protein
LLNEDSVHGAGLVGVHVDNGVKEGDELFGGEGGDEEESE